MPLPADEQVVKTSSDLVSTLQGAFKTPPGFRPAHARGTLLNGTFIPTSEAKSLTSAPHFNNPSTPVIVRFSSSTGLPHIPDTDPNAMPRGFAVRFVLGFHKHTDIISHSTPHFPTRTGAEFLEMLQAIGASATSTEHPSPIEKFLGSHPGALAFVQAPKPSPVSFATEGYFGLNAFKFVSAEGKTTFVRYRITPVAGLDHLDEEALKEKSENYLYDELVKRVSTGPISFKLLAQIGEEGDVTDDVTKHWPEDRKIVELGTVKVESVIPDPENAEEQKKIIFDPIPRVQGIEPSDDPLLDVRAAVYLISGKQRRAA